VDLHGRQEPKEAEPGSGLVLEGVWPSGSVHVWCWFCPSHGSGSLRTKKSEPPQNRAPATMSNDKVSSAPGRAAFRTQRDSSSTPLFNSRAHLHTTDLSNSIRRGEHTSQYTRQIYGKFFLFSVPEELHTDGPPEGDNEDMEVGFLPEEIFLCGFWIAAGQICTDPHKGQWIEIYADKLVEPYDIRNH
jgi:hypothetical protein